MKKIYKEANTTAASSGGGGVGFTAGQGAQYTLPLGWKQVKLPKRPYSTTAIDYVQTFPKYKMAKTIKKY